MRDATLTIPARFNGPRDSGNGGYTAGLLARVLGGDGPAEVTLKAPPPLGRELAVERSTDGVVLRDGDTVVADAQPTTVDVAAPRPVDLGAATAAAAGGPFVDAERHPFPSCFVCGPERSEGDGLRIFVGPVDGGEVFAGAWRPPPSLATADGALPEAIVWSALDCPTSGPVANDPDQPDFRPIVLARFAARVDAPVTAGHRHIVMAWPLAVYGRKREAAAALYTADGTLCAVSRALWIELRAGRTAAGEARPPG